MSRPIDAVDLRGLQPTWLRYFHEVARCLSIREAARRLEISPSAISRQVQDIEEIVGSRLLERLPHGIRLTAAGESVAYHAAQGMRHMEHMQQALDDMAGVRGGMVRIAAVQAASAELVPSIVAEFARRHTRVSYQCSFTGSESVLASVQSGGADVGLSFHHQARARVRHLVSVPLPLGAIMAPDHPLAARKKLALHDLEGHAVVLPDRTISTRAALDDLLHSTTLELSTLCTASSPEFIVAAVASGIGIGFQTPVGVERELREGKLVFVPIVDRKLEPPHLTVSVGANRQASVTAQMLAESFRKAVSELLDFARPGARSEKASPQFSA